MQKEQEDRRAIIDTLRLQRNSIRGNLYKGVHSVLNFFTVSLGHMTVQLFTEIDFIAISHIKYFHISKCL